MKCEGVSVEGLSLVSDLANLTARFILYLHGTWPDKMLHVHALCVRQSRQSILYGVLMHVCERDRAVRQRDGEKQEEDFSLY